MFKRANKVTALLVAAASVMSIVPAMASTRIGTKDGHITGNAIAYANGKYIYDGYRTNDDNNGIYYNNGSDATEKFNEDLRDYTLTSKYGTKYAYGVDGNDQYLIDLETGKTVDDQTPEDKADSIKSSLKSKLKKTDRYSNTGAWDTVDLGDSTETEKYVDSTRLFGDKFGDVWYKYQAAGDKAATSTTIGTVARAASFTIKLPTSYTVGTSVTVGGISYTASSLAELQDRILNGHRDANGVALDAMIGVKHDTTVTNVFDGTISIVGSNIVGYTKATGEISKVDPSLTAFAAAYGVTLGDGSVTGSGISETATSLGLGTLKSATSSNQDVATSIVNGSNVIISKGNLGKATITVTDTTANVATIAVTVTSSAATGLTSITTVDNAFFDTTTPEVKAALAVVANSGTVANATLPTFTALGLGDLVTADGTPGTHPTLTVKEAQDAITAYIATGKLGATVTDVATVRTILAAKLATKVAAQASTDQVIVDRGAGTVNGSLGDPDKYVGFVNSDGKYVDVSDLANIYVYSKAAQKTVKVKEYNKEYSDYGMTVGLQNIEVLAQDKDYIYTLTTVGVTEKNPTTNIVGPVETQYFVQKIAKAQGDNKDGAYIPKSVDSYQVDNKIIFDDGDSQTAFNLLVNKIDGDGYIRKNVSVKDGALIITGAMDNNTTDNDKIKVFKISLKKDKIDTVSTYGQGKQANVDVYIAKKDADHDMEIKDGTMNTALAYDNDGNTWVISKGTITKFTGTDSKDIYTCDRTFTHLSVYDDNNLIAWDNDSDVYTNVAEGTKVTQGESTAVAPVIVTGWVKGTDGTWTFNDATGTKVVSKWQNLGGVWYFLKADGIMATGWYNDNGTWYYLNGSGAMQTGWLNDNGTWYYLAGSGAMLSNTTVDGYVLGASGAWVK